MVIRAFRRTMTKNKSCRQQTRRILKFGPLMGFEPRPPCTSRRSKWGTLSCRSMAFPTCRTACSTWSLCFDNEKPPTTATRRRPLRRRQCPTSWSRWWCTIPTPRRNPIWWKRGCIRRPTSRRWKKRRPVTLRRRWTTAIIPCRIPRRRPFWDSIYCPNPICTCKSITLTRTIIVEKDHHPPRNHQSPSCGSTPFWDPTTFSSKSTVRRRNTGTCRACSNGCTKRCTSWRHRIERP
mmetsp:Transcript_17385/g.47463  ORF Transcript_17385/g.47463 Transcript_17385/m.47463 type:complete len:236 (+) Transcript_17385:596-1303(+)